MKMILNMVKRDLIRSRRDNILIYIILSPVILAVVAALLMPSVTSNRINGFVTPGVYQTFGAELDKLGFVQVVKNEAEVEEAVALEGDGYGLIESNGSYSIILEGDEGVSFENSLEGRIVGPLINGVSNDENDAAKLAMIKGYTIVMLLMLTLLLGGMTAGFLMVEERAQKTMASMSISPVSILNYMLSKSILSFMIPLIMGAVVAVITMGTDWSLSSYLIASVAGFPAGIILGLFLGYAADSQITALAVVKLTMPVFLSIPFASIFVPRSLSFLFYIFPNYWTFKTLETAFLGNMAQYQNILLPGLLSLGTGMVVLVLFMPKVAKRIGLK